MPNALNISYGSPYSGNALSDLIPDVARKSSSIPQFLAAAYGAQNALGGYIKDNALFGLFSDKPQQEYSPDQMREEVAMRAIDMITPIPGTLVSKGIQKIPTKGLGVDMGHLQIADKNLKVGKGSVTPDSPVDVTHNIDTGEYRLTDGYHRYLASRGGSIDEALKRSRAGDFNDINANVTQVRNRKTADGFMVEEPID